jgi:hypothetical protein
VTALARRLLEDALSADARGSLAELEDKARKGGAAWLDVHFASLPRKIGRETLRGGITSEAEVSIVAESYRLCDLAAALVIDAGGIAGEAEAIEQLYFRGDHEERRMTLKALPFLPITEASRRLLQEAHRTNEEPIFLAGFADQNLPARALDDDDYARGILKAAFIDLDLDRLLGAETRTSPGLSKMLLDFMSEREAAHRPVWAGSLPLCAHAPCPGVRAKVTGDLWSGVDARRLAAARAVAIMGADSFADEIAARLEVERHEPTRAALSALAAN